jgi:hypothetical protein
METGEFGVLGYLVAPLVEVELRQEQETVTLQLPQVEAQLALDEELKVRLATMQHVPSVCITKNV